MLFYITSIEGKQHEDQEMTIILMGKLRLCRRSLTGFPKVSRLLLVPPGRGRVLKGCCPNPFSFVLSRLFNRLRRTPSGSETRPPGANPAKEGLVLPIAKICGQKKPQRTVKRDFGLGNNPLTPCGETIVIRR